MKPEDSENDHLSRTSSLETERLSRHDTSRGFKVKESLDLMHWQPITKSFKPPCTNNLTEIAVAGNFIPVKLSDIG